MKPKVNAPVINPVSQLPPPIIPQQQQPVQRVFAVGKNNKETLKNLQQYLKDTTGLNISSTSLSSDLSVEEFNQKANQVAKLFDEYNLNSGLNNKNDIKLSFKSGSRLLGFVKTDVGVNSSGQYYKKTELIEMNFGSKNESTQSITFVPGSTEMRYSSAVDIINKNISTVTHEFAHVLGFSRWAENSENPDVYKRYFAELRQIRQQYRDEMLQLNRNRNREGVYNISLGRYADTNIDEFHAEAFKEYKLSNNPSKYALLVGKLIDKYFKK